MPAQGSRTYDVVVFGATGFTGGLTAAELARRAPAGCRWAIAGRSRRRLEGVRAGLAADDPSLAELPVIVADVDDPGSMRDLAASTRVLITTVGPYLRLRRPGRGRLRGGGHRLPRPHRRGRVRRPDLADATTSPPSAPAPASCTPPGSTPSPTTSASASPSGHLPVRRPARPCTAT